MSVRGLENMNRESTFTVAPIPIPTSTSTSTSISTSTSTSATTSASTQSQDQSEQHAPKKWKRRGFPRSRNGCITCRVRRVKCDEAKPVCKRCLRAQFTCDGYFQDNADSKNEQAIVRKPVPKVLPKTSPNACLSVLPSDVTSGGDARSFDFFRSRTATMLSGYFDADFWTGALLQIGLSDATVWHSALAVSALHEESLVREGKQNHFSRAEIRAFALKHYNAAISRLANRISHDEASRDVLLVSCILFVCIENMLGNVAAAITHVHSGIHLIRSWTKDQPSQSTNLLEDTLSPVFDYVNQHSFIYGRVTPPRPQVFIHQKDKPEQFKDLHEAHTSLQMLKNNAHAMAIPFRFKPPNPDAAWWAERKAEFEEVKQQVPRWVSAFDKLLENSTFDEKDKRAASYLKNQLSLATTWINDNVFTTELGYDAFLNIYTNIVDVAEKAVGKDHTDDPTTYSLQLQDLSALYLTALKCRNPKVRRKAVDVMKRCPRRQGFWDSKLVIWVVEKVIELEEEGLADLKDSAGDVVPDNWARIVTVVVDPEKDDEVAQSTMVTFVRQEHGLLGQWSIKDEKYYPSKC